MSDDGKHNNMPLIEEILQVRTQEVYQSPACIYELGSYSLVLQLRAEMAGLLGYDSYAAVVSKHDEFCIKN